ncbi:MAG: SAM-dependent methyltransferase [Pseudomonadota bacterium]
MVPASILELARREAVSIETGKSGFGPSMPQADITACLLEHAAAGHHVVRLKSGDPSIFGRLDEERAACDQAGIASTVIPGITAASAAAAALGRALTRRGRNSRLSFLTAHDIKGFADHDWRSLARPDHVAAFYMAKRAAVFLQGRLLMHGAAPDTPLAVLWNVSQPQEHRLSTTLATLAADMEAVPTEGPAVLLYGLTADAAAAGAHWATAPLFQPHEIAQ